MLDEEVQALLIGVGNGREGRQVSAPVAGDTKVKALMYPFRCRGFELAGFRIVGDARTPLGIGVLVERADVALVDLEVLGAMAAAVELGAGAAAECRVPRLSPERRSLDICSGVAQRRGVARHLGSASHGVGGSDHRRSGRAGVRGPPSLAPPDDRDR